MLGTSLCSGARPYQPVYGDPLHEAWRWRTYPELSGLDVQCLAEGADGRMWFGTANNLWSYDGIQWVRQDTVVERFVTALCSGKGGQVYAGDGWNISQLDGGKWSRVFSAAKPTGADADDGPVRRLTCSDTGSLWAATDLGALHGEGSNWVLFTDATTAGRLRDGQCLPPPSIVVLPGAITARLKTASASTDGRCRLSDVALDRDGRIWFGTAGGQVLCHTPDQTNVNAGAWSIHDASDGVGPGLVTCVAPLRDGTVWVLHADSEKADVFDGTTWRAVQLPLYLPALDLGDAGGRLLQTRDGVLWLSARYHLFAYRNGHWQAYGQPNLPYPNTRNALLQSADGALWFAGSNSDIHRIDYQTPRWQTLMDLNFQWESPGGTQWFLHRDGRVVVHDGDRWTSLGVEDGLMDMPVALLGTRRGQVWAAGSHEGVAATAHFDGRRWQLELHEDFSFSVEWRALFESSDGSVWFGAYVDTDGPERHRDGILQFRDGTWTHHYQPGRSPHPEIPDDPSHLLPRAMNPDRPIEKYICFGESRDGKVWAGRNILATYDGRSWRTATAPPSVASGNIECMLSTREGDLWIGMRESGAWRFDGSRWKQYQGRDSLQANSIRSLVQTDDGTIWTVTDRGSSRFDGNSWMDDVLPEPLHFSHEAGSLKASPSGQLWINRYTLYWMRRAWSKSPPPEPGAEFFTVSHQFRGQPPRTSITLGPKVISQPGNLAVLWSGEMPWQEAKHARLQFSYRLDGEAWSSFTSDRGHSFFTLPDGNHRLEVRARDADFNVDPTPAVLDFTVLPPVWRQAWFILLMVLLGGLVITQTARVLKEQGRLRRMHAELEIRVQQRTAELEAANRELGAANRELEAFSYSVSHDLRAPLRSIDGFCSALMEDYGPKLDEDGRGDLQRVRAAAQRMGQLIEDMLKLSRVTRTELHWTRVNLSELVRDIVGDLARHQPERRVQLSVAPEVVVTGDENLLRIALENLLGNAWKFTSKRDETRIEFGEKEQAGERIFYVRDNGAGFDMAFVNKLFGAFQRLHSASEFPGTGVGLAIVQRVVLRHGGRVWAEGAVEGGATFSFTLANHTPL